METSLTNRRVEIRVSDPWEVSQSCLWPVLGTVLREIGIAGASRTVDRALLIEVDSPINDSYGASIALIVAYPRYDGDTFGSSQEIVVNFAGLSSLPTANEPIDAKSWKGIGHGTLVLR